MKDLILLNKLLANTNKHSGVYGIGGNYPTECWVWLGGTGGGYGMIWDPSKQKTVRTHRVTYTYYYQEPGKQCVLHKCDNRPCVRPDHLFLGTRRDNVLDMDRKHRRVSVSKEKHGRSKLTQEQVDSIRLEYPSLGYTLLARKYYVTRAAIRNIIKRRSWK